jgi:hypothetical protein
MMMMRGLASSARAVRYLLITPHRSTQRHLPCAAALSR